MTMSGQFPPPALVALEQFASVFADDAPYSGLLGAAWAPGRVNLIGEHTDYNDGFVLPMAVNRVVAFAGRPRPDHIVRLWSNYFSEHAEVETTTLPASFEKQRDGLPGWARYVLGVMVELQALDIPLAGFDAVIDGDVPVGGGMSSSAAIEVATVQACMLFSQGQWSIGERDAALRPLSVAALCQRAEHRASGVMSGILDQAASCLGRVDQAVLLDCRSLEYRYLPFDDPGISLMVIDTSVRRELAGSAYNERRRQCEEATTLLRDIVSRQESAAAAMNIRALRDITPEQFARYGDQLPEVLRRRAGYVIAEDARVLETVALLEVGDMERVGQLLWRSHEGLRDDYQVSCFELDTLVEIASRVPGVLGARMLGGGFGGCTINLARNEAIDALRLAVQEQYPPRTGRQASIDICHAANGPDSGWTNIT